MVILRLYYGVLMLMMIMFDELRFTLVIISTSETGNQASVFGALSGGSQDELGSHHFTRWVTHKLYDFIW